MTYYPTSTAPAAQAYLATQIQTQLASDPTGKDVLLAFAASGTANDTVNEIIQIGAVRRDINPSAFVGSGGQFSLEEVYDIACGVSVWTGSVDTDGRVEVQIQQIQRAWQLVSYFETAIRLDPSLGELVQIAYPAQTEQDQLEWTPQAAGTLVEITFAVHVEAVI